MPGLRGLESRIEPIRTATVRVAGPKLKDTQAAKAFGVAVRAIESLRRQLVEEGLEGPRVPRGFASLDPPTPSALQAPP